MSQRTFDIEEILNTIKVFWNKITKPFNIKLTQAWPGLELFALLL